MIIREATRRVKIVDAEQVAFPQIMGAGYESLQAILDSNFPAPFLLGAFSAKALAIAVGLGGGMVGGLFGPALLMGTMFGAGVGGIVGHWLPFSTQAFPTLCLV